MNKYLVIYEIDGELSEPSIETASDIFGKMDMSDCYDITIVKIWLIKKINLIACQFYGTWHNPKEPLRMEIRPFIPTIPKQPEDIKPYDIGYGTDH